MNCCVPDNVIAAVLGNKLIELLDTPTATVATLLVPRGPVQVSE